MLVHDVIVVGCDGSEAARTAVDWAVERAGRLGADLVLAYGIPEYWLPPAASVLPGIVNASTNMLEAEADRVRARLPRSSVHALARLGEPAAVLGQLSEQADLVVVGTDKHADAHGEGFGVVDLQVATISACNVAVIPHHRLGKPTGGVVVGVDGSPESNRALDIAACEAAALGHPLTILYATAPPKPWLLDHLSPETQGERIDADQRKILEEASGAAGKTHPDLEIRTDFDAQHKPADALVRSAANADLLVLGSKGRGALKHMLIGSVGSAVIAHVPCPTLLTRSPRQTP